MTTPRRAWLRVLALPVALALAVSACAAPSGSHDTARTVKLARRGPRRIRVTVRDGTVSPSLGVVDLGVGEALALTVLSDVDGLIEAAGFAVERVVEAGAAVTVWLVGGRAGVHEVGLGCPGLPLLRVAVG